MPNLAVWHPAIVHFAVAFLVIGVIFRWISLTARGRAAWTGPAAATLLLLGTFAAAAAVHSGINAHGPVERVPGARQAVIEHEVAGVWARNIFILVAALELAAIAVRRRNRRGMQVAFWGSAIVGVFGLGALYKAGNRGGDLVYRYAGGVGIRYGDTADVNRLYLAALYQSGQQARALHDSGRAAEMFAELRSRFPADTTVRFLAIESLIRDRNDGRSALAELRRLSVPAEDQRLRLRHGLLQADAHLAAGHPDSARAVLEQLARDFPNQQRVRDRLAQIK
jgi:uncharacterized membrane protein